MWRCRGEGGWGSFWGLCAVGTAMTLLIYAFYGSKIKMKYEHFFAGPLMLGAGVTEYATIITQMSGLEYSFVPYGADGECVSLPVNQWSGMGIMLIMGFILAPLFCFYVGTLFSEKEYKIHHYIIAIAVFYAVSFIFASGIFDIGRGIFEGTNGIGDFFSRLITNEGFLYTVMFATFVLIMAIYLPTSKKLKTENKNRKPEIT